MELFISAIDSPVDLPTGSQDPPHPRVFTTKESRLPTDEYPRELIEEILPNKLEVSNTPVSRDSLQFISPEIPPCIRHLKVIIEHREAWQR